jgi:hypothetical protein
MLKYIATRFAAYFESEIKALENANGSPEI